MSPTGQGLSDRIEIKVPCKPEYVRTVRRTISDFAANMKMPRSAIEEIEVAASEAVSNIVRHAYADYHFPPPLSVKCFHKNGKLVLEVVDKGCGFDAPSDDSTPEGDPDKEGGYGIILIKTLMDRVKFDSKPDHGTRIRMTKHARDSVAEAVRRRARHAKAQV